MNRRRRPSGTILLSTRSDRYRYVFVTQAEVEGKVRTNTEIVVHESGILQVAEGNRAIADASLARHTAGAASIWLVIE